MTIEIAEFKCPTCGHLMGEEEYELASRRMNKIIQETSNGQIEKIKSECDDKVRNAETKADSRILEQENRHKHELETEVNRIARLEIQRVQSKNDEEKQEMESRHRSELAHKDREMEEAKLQAINDNDEKYKQKENERELKRLRTEQENRNLLNQVEKLQKTLENVPPEFRGTAAEMKLFDDLHAAFQHDDLTSKKVGLEMPDVIQTVVTQNGERIRTPIVWDMKTGENITAKDIEKAKRYKEIYNTDYCIVVTAKGITANDSKTFRTGLIGEREGVLLVHPKMVIALAEITRKFVIEKTKLIKNSNGRESKQIRLYEYVTSSARLRKMQEKIRKKSKLDELQRKEEAYAIKTWTARKNLVQKWFEMDRDDQKMIDSMTEKEGDDGRNDEEDISSDEKEEDLT